MWILHEKEKESNWSSRYSQSLPRQHSTERTIRRSLSFDSRHLFRSGTDVDVTWNFYREIQIERQSWTRVLRTTIDWTGLDVEKLEDQGHLVHHPNSISQIGSIRCLARIRLISPRRSVASLRNNFFVIATENFFELLLIRSPRRVPDRHPAVGIVISRGSPSGEARRRVKQIEIGEQEWIGRSIVWLILGIEIIRSSCSILGEWPCEIQWDSEEKTSSRIIEEHGQSPRWIQIEWRRAQRMKNVNQQSMDRRSPRQ